MKIREYSGCLIWVIIIIVLIVLIRYCDRQSEVQNKQNQDYIALIKSTSKGPERIYMLQELLKRDGLSRNEERFYSARLVFEYEETALLDSALNALDAYEKKYEKSVFTTYHRAGIHLAKGDTLKAKALLLDIINDKIAYSPLNWLNRTFQRWINDGRSEEFNRYHDYLYGTLGQEYALGLYANMNQDQKENIELITSFFKNRKDLNGILDDYLSLKRTHSKDISFFDTQLYNIHLNHLYLNNSESPTLIQPDIARGLLYSRVNFINNTIIIADSLYGLGKVKSILSDVGTITSQDFTDLLLIRAFKKYADINRDFASKSTYQDYKGFSKNGGRYLTICSPTTSQGVTSAVINKGVTKDFVILKCNDWNICDSTSIFTRNTISQYAGQNKEIIILYDDYTTDTLHISEDKMGVSLRYSLVREPVYQMLIHDFFANHK